MYSVAVNEEYFRAGSFFYSPFAFGKGKIFYISKEKLELEYIFI